MAQAKRMLVSSLPLTLQVKKVNVPLTLTKTTNGRYELFKLWLQQET